MVRKKFFGFTLIEAIIVIFVFLLAISAIFGSALILYKTHSFQWDQIVAVEEARKGIETMVREIRMAQFGEDGSYLIEFAGDKEFIFFSDIDGDGRIERVRYFLAQTNSKTLTQECQSSEKGGSCLISFSNFLTPGGVLKSAFASISVDGDLGSFREFAEIYVDGQKLGEICKSGCQDCKGQWQGTQTYDVTNFALDNSILFSIKATDYVDPSCPYSLKAKVVFSFTEDISALSHEFKKGVIKPVGSPPTYPRDQEKISVLSYFVRNQPPIFEYFDRNGNKLDYPAPLKEISLIKVYLIVNVDPTKPPKEYEMISFVNLRNLPEK